MTDGRPTRLPFITEVLKGRVTRAQHRESLEPSNSRSRTSPVIVDIESPLSEIDGFSPMQDGLPGTLKMGDLIKTSRSRSNNEAHGPSRKRRFRVSEEAIEYFQLFSHVKVKKSFPITSILDIKIMENNPSSFQVVFQNFTMELEASSPTEADDWIATIQKCVSDWREDDVGTSMSLMRSVKSEEDAEDKITEYGPLSPQERRPSPIDTCVNVGAEFDNDSICEPPVMREKVVRPFSPSRTRSKTVGEMLKTWSTEENFSLGMYGKRKGRGLSVRKKLHLAPKLEKQVPVFFNTNNEEEHHWRILHDDFAMIKYPRRLWHSIPSEKIFQLDKDNLQIMWKKTSASRTKISSTLKLDSILEIRLGQQTDGFNKFPYEEVANQSFSLVYEDLSGKYAKLGSLDLICDHPFHFEKWIEGLRSLQIGPLTAMFPTRYANTDPILIWLKRFWSCYSINHELGQRDAIKLMKMLHPTVSYEQLKLFLTSAHNHQHEASIGTGFSLRWDGFVLLYNLLVGETGQLNSIYRNYAKSYKRLGMTIEEFKEFLIKECHYKEQDCQRRRLKELIAFHDHHHLAFKKYTGNNKPSNWKISCKLLSYAGFLSFLRSKHNAAVNPIHDTIYQDMDQPLSHYFINSSHNTYLETDQIKGRSTLDAYVRSLLQGCRCVEIDCWDNTTGKEPIIYHGFTFTSKLPLRAVIRTINKYAFHMSHYPVVISIENHCNEQQQARMARIFQEEFRNELGQCIVATDNLVEGSNTSRRRLPSPTELQGRILLKGSYKIQMPKTKKAFTQQSSPLLNHLSLPSSPIKMATDNSITESLTGSYDGIVDSPSTKNQWEWPNPDDDSTIKPVNNGSIILSRGRTRREAKKFSARIDQADNNIETQEDDQELTYSETSRDLRNMIVYCRSTSIKPWSWKEQRKTSICQMFSFGELSAANHCKRSPREMLSCTERQFVRTYPKGARIDSSNYNPVPFWNHGIQMAAINFQTPDLYMHLNQGRFRQNGGCGYVLKPEIMRKIIPTFSGNYPFDPLMDQPHPLISTCQLDLELLTGQNLTLLDKPCTSLSVHISTHGIQADQHTIESAESTDMFCPTWPSGYKTLSHLILMPELCLVYFRVDISVRGAGRTLFGQNCIALPSLQPGIKYIQLRKAGGELIPESGLFVKITMKWNQPTLPTDSPTTEPTTMDSSTNEALFNIKNVQGYDKCRSHLVHQDEIDVTTTLSPEAIAMLNNENTTVEPSCHYSSLDYDQIVNEVELDIQKGDETETQTATLKIQAEI